MSDTGRPDADPSQPGGRPAWTPTGPAQPVTPPPVTSWQAAQTPPPSQEPPVAAAPAAVPPATGDGPTEPPASSNRRWLVPAIIAVVVLVVAAIVIGIVTSKDDDTAAPPAVASTVLLPSPTPTVAPVPRTATTAFATALPTSVLQYALATSAENPTWIAAGAVEAYTETYTDGGTVTVTVDAGQWETAPEATAYAATLAGNLPVASAPMPSVAPGAPVFPQTGDVTAGGATVGTYTIADMGDGTGTAVWTNGTSVFQVTAPLADIVDFYSAYPL